MTLYKTSCVVDTIGARKGGSGSRIIFSHILTAHAQKQLFLSFWLQLRQRHWIQRPRFPIRRGYFGNPEIRHISTSGPLDLISWKVGHVLPWWSGYLSPNLNAQSKCG